MDLKKAYNSVPREALWLALKKLGIPTLLIELIRSFHEGMKVLLPSERTFSYGSDDAVTVALG